MSPEQARGKPASQFSDQYSLGIVFYQCLTGRLPFQADNPVDIGLQHIKEPVPPLPEPCRIFQPIIDKLLAKKPRQRYAGDTELLEALELLEQQYFDPDAPPIRLKPAPQRHSSRNAVLAAAATLAVAVIGAGWYLAPGLGFRTVRVQQAQSAVVSAEEPTNSAAVNAGTPAAPEVATNRLPAAGVSAAPPAAVIQPDMPPQQVEQSFDPAASVLQETGQETLAGGSGTDAEAVATGETDDTIIRGSETDGGPFLPDLGKIELVSIDTETDIEAVIDDVYSDQTVDQLLAEAEENLRAMRLTTPYRQNALNSYQRVLELDPGNEAARSGLRQIATRYLTLAREKLEYGDVATSLAHIDRGLSVVPDHSGLRALRDQINARSEDPSSTLLPGQTAAAPAGLESPEGLPPSGPVQARPDNRNVPAPRGLGWGSR
jgi:hypothetical protein